MLMSGFQRSRDRLGGGESERSHRVREVLGSISGRVIPKTLKMVVMAAPLALRVPGLALRLTGWCQDIWTSRLVTYPENAVI